MPWIVAGLAAAGLAAALVGRRWALVTWLGALGVAGVAGLADFWKWGYDYGHDLDPHAIIRIPDMAYQPPLIGSKQLLNFTAHSWPDVGGVLAGLACALGVAALVLAWRTQRRVGVAAVAGVLALAGCAPKVPRAIAYGREACAECRMVADDPRFGAELVTAKGRLYVFDSIECLAAFTLAKGGDARGLWVTDYAHPGTLLPVDSARFRRLAGAAGSPMGKGLAATSLDDRAAEMAWPDVLALVRAEGLAGEAQHAH
jgi:copper chaperone NosL